MDFNNFTGQQKIGFVVAHYDQYGNIAEHLLNTLKYLSKYSTHIYFVSTNLNRDSQTKASEFAHVITRENLGYDFFSYKIGIQHALKKAEFDQLFIFNDSIVIFNPDHLFKLFFEQKNELSLTGLTLSYEINKHIQSYFFHIHKNIIYSDFHLKWWDNLIALDNKNDIIQKYEIGYSKLFIENNIELRPLFEPTKHDKFVSTLRKLYFSRETPHFKQFFENLQEDFVKIDLKISEQTNPIHYNWESVLEKYKILKKDLFIKNNSLAKKEEILFRLKNHKNIHFMKDIS